MFQFPKDLKEKLPSVESLRKELLVFYIDSSNVSEYKSILQTSHCLEIVLSGKRGVISSVDKQFIVSGDVQFRKRDNYIFETSHDYKGLLFFFENTFITDFLREHVIAHTKREIDEQFSPFTFKTTAFIQSNIKEIVNAFTSNREYKSCIIKFSLHQILLQILDRNKDKVYVTYLKYLVNNKKIDLQYYMENNFTQTLSLESLAKQTGRSLSTFKKDFKDQFKTSPMKWLINRRLKHANYLIITTNDPVSEIAFQCGFENVSHFSKVYKNLFKTSPLKSRV